MKRFALIMLAVSLAVAGGISYFASPHPDGLEKVAEEFGFLEKAQEPAHIVLPGYTVPGLGGFLSNGLAGIIGVLATFGVTVLLTRIAKKSSLAKARRRKEKIRG